MVGREERNISHKDCIGMDYILLSPTKHQQVYGIGGFRLRPSMCMLQFMGACKDSAFIGLWIACGFIRLRVLPRAF